MCRVFGTCHTCHLQCGFYVACSGMSGYTPLVVGWIVSAASKDAPLLQILHYFFLSYLRCLVNVQPPILKEIAVILYNQNAFVKYFPDIQI